MKLLSFKHGPSLTFRHKENKTVFRRNEVFATSCYSFRGNMNYIKVQTTCSFLFLPAFSLPSIKYKGDKSRMRTTKVLWQFRKIIPSYLIILSESHLVTSLTQESPSQSCSWACLSDQVNMRYIIQKKLRDATMATEVEEHELMGKKILLQTMFQNKNA